LPDLLLGRYRESGVEVIHLYTGRMLCALPLSPDPLHADLDRDGALDELFLHSTHGERSVGAAATNLLQS
jgi:hypothetical protein